MDLREKNINHVREQIKEFTSQYCFNLNPIESLQSQEIEEVSHNEVLQNLNRKIETIKREKQINYGFWMTYPRLYNDPPDYWRTIKASYQGKYRVNSCKSTQAG